jgi:hypothetical protein
VSRKTHRFIPATPSAGAPDAIVIDEVRLEKESVCRGEENVVTVIAHTADPADAAWLRVEVNGVAGDRVPLREWTSQEPGAEPTRFWRPVVVTGRGGATARVDLEQPAPRDCTNAQELFVAHETEPLSDGRVRFRAELVHLSDGVSPSIESIAWSFDDGTTEITEGAVGIAHDYSSRPQRTAVSSFLVEARARLSTGDVVRGRAVVTLDNPLFAGGDADVVAIVADPAAEPVADADGARVEQTFRLRHGAAGPVRIERVTRRRLLQSELGTPRPAAPAALSVDEIASTGTSVTLSLELDRDGDVVADEYELEGRTADGRPARGRLFVRRPDVPARLLARLDRPAFRARLERARALLGVARVTEEDIYRLELNGAFNDLALEEQGE